MILSKCIQSELEPYIQGCNFTDDEMQYFLLKAKGKTDVQIADAMFVSTRKVTTLSSRVRAKMSRL